jgi:hypothetical protein
VQITINTIQGTFVVPHEKESSLILWLQQNAIRVGQQPIREQSPDQNYSDRQLITEKNTVYWRT